MTRHGIAVMAGCLALSVSAVACTPWTTRPIHDDGRPAGATATQPDAPTFVAGIWESRVLPEVAANAMALKPGQPPEWLPGRTAAFVRGAGVVVSVDTRSRVGRALVDLDPMDGRPDVSLQIGPVLRGTAVRDALPFISFSDYSSQITFAEVAGALNARILDSVLKDVAPAMLTGRRVAFAGATPAARTSDDAPIDVVPLTLEIRSP